MTDLSPVPSATAAAPRVEVMGVRHHGPGSARAVARALDELEPDVVLVEGPADCDHLIEFLTGARLTPPVALLAAVADDPGTSAFWPFASFSPEWQALRWATERGVPARFIDLPAGVTLAARPAAVVPVEDEDDEQDDGPTSPAGVRHDPIAALAAAGGYDDPERWWEDVVESRTEHPTPFSSITAAMVELRAAAPELDAHEARREAHMRQQVRAALKAGHQRVAVVCGAWHAPALSGKLPPATGDAKLLAGMPRKKVTLTWVPWTASRLARAAGYGAGITSPGWYEHLFTTQDDVIASWLVQVGAALRDKDLPVSSAHVIEAVRLADALATVRGRHVAGLAEVTEATRAVLCDGDDSLVQHVTAQLVVGERLGEVAADVPTVPLDADLRATAKRLRLAFSAAPKALDLDLRRDTDLVRSRLLHRLTLLGIGWGDLDAARSRSTGTFREAWTLLWRPELSVAVVEAAQWGTTVQSAATARCIERAATGDLSELTALLEVALLADLPAAASPLLTRVDEQAAHDGDIARLMAALPPLVRAHRYSDVRGTSTAELARVTDSLVVRICAGLPAAVTGIDDDAATVMRGHVDATHAAVRLRADDDGTRTWHATLRALADRPDISGALTGRATRLLLDAGELDVADVRARVGVHLSYGTPARAQAAWVDGFLAGGGLLLAHDRALLAVVDDWVATLPAAAFTDVLPMLRRTFGAMPPAERRNVGDAARALTTGTITGAGAAPPGTVLDPDLVAGPVRTVALLLGARL
ncbi:hypothetical protein Cch01nite_05360 [Cellulomonas chitinilytica]|uniref:Uncharacterized protein n=1 Tax=Cellulomonas chitinilytica TaxID=398759 RepID=A0A919NYE4_9CELL|nr:DUF5682 family protein [Cellulomonas chitinilytica]GIG19812.1 hypothetical protein Cch01nite_05360 [Cellulomonas chitinilytica]